MKYLTAGLALWAAGCASTPATAPPNSQKDINLVGTWIGERTASADCSAGSWETTRDEGGSYVVSFYTDSERTEFAGREYGYWWTKNGSVYFLTPNRNKAADVYGYNVEEGGNSISFRSSSTNNASACGANYRFQDNKVDT